LTVFCRLGNGVCGTHPRSGCIPNTTTNKNNKTSSYNLWTDPAVTGTSLATKYVAAVNGGGTKGQQLTAVVAFGFEVGKSCAGAVAGARVNGAAAAFALDVTSRTTGVLNVTANLDFDTTAKSAQLCLTLQAPCATLPALCAYGGGATCGSWVLLSPYRTKGACTGSCPNDRDSTWICNVKDAPCVRYARCCFSKEGRGYWGCVVSTGPLR
jgi:hypothetical protein